MTPETISNADAIVAKAAFHISLGMLDEVKALPEPVPFGLAQKWERTLISPEKTAHIFEAESDTNWFGYASAMDEIRAVFEAKEKVPFVQKRKSA